MTIGITDFERIWKNEIKGRIWYYKNKKTPCEYCSYKNVCGFNSGLYKTEYNFINKKQKEDIFEKLEKEN